MAYSTIDIGGGAVNGDANSEPQTILSIDNAANASGILNSFEVWFQSAGVNVRMGTFSGSSTTWTSRDSVFLDDVDYGSKQTWTGDNCAVSTGDILGIYWTNGYLEKTSSGNRLLKTGDQFTGSAVTFTSASSKNSIYATGITIPDAPTSVAATDGLSGKVTITWTAGTGETGGHRVYRDGVDISGVVAHGTATFDDTTVAAGTTYAYTVKAINDAGLSAASSADNGMAALSFLYGIMKHKYIPSMGVC